MDHPLIHEAQKGLRKRVVHFFRHGYKVQRESNIIFVCGGNDANDMRALFKDYTRNNSPEYDIFHPEFAMENLFSSGFPEPFDITDFEALVGSLSRAIVIFPEAPGSFAETGYFSAIDHLCEKIILVLDSEKQKDDSFISLGPAKKIGQKSRFYPVIQMSYNSPDFNVIVERMRRVKLKKTMKILNWNKLSDLTDYEWFCLTHEAVRFLTIATIEDLKYIFRSMSDGHLSVNKLHQIASILVGSKYLIEYSEFGHLRANSEKSALLEISSGNATEHNELRLELANLYQDSGGEFKTLVDGV